MQPTIRNAHFSRIEKKRAWVIKFSNERGDVFYDVGPSK